MDRNVTRTHTSLALVVALLDQLRTKGMPDSAITGYELNPQGENISRLKADYYPTIIQGKSKQWIDVYVMNRYGIDQSGKPVFSSYKPELHRAAEPVSPAPGIPITVGLDFGLPPAAIFGHAVRGQWRIPPRVSSRTTGA